MRQEKCKYGGGEQEGSALLDLGVKAETAERTSLGWGFRWKWRKRVERDGEREDRRRHGSDC